MFGNRTVQQSNIIELNRTWSNTSTIRNKPVSSGLKQSVAVKYISLTLAPLVKTQLKSEFLPILLRVNAYQCCIPFCFSTEQNRTNRVDWVRLGSVIELNRTHKKVPVRLCSIAEPIELQSNDWVRLGSIGFWFGFFRLTTPGVYKQLLCNFFIGHLVLYWLDNPSFILKIRVKRSLWLVWSFQSVGPKCPFPFDKIVAPSTALLYPACKKSVEPENVPFHWARVGCYEN